MTQGRDGISLAHPRALKLMGVARRLSLVAAVFVVAALVAGTAGTSYAKSKKKTNIHVANLLEDTVVVSNYGAVFDGSLETFVAGAGHNARPHFRITGPATFLGASSGAAGDAVSSMNDHHIAVAIPIDFFDLTGCGPFGQPAASPAYGTGLVELFGPDSTGNSAPENIICSPNFAFGAPNTTGVFYPQGVAFESPYDGVNPAGHDILAVANQFPLVFGSPDCPASSDPEATCSAAACAPAPSNIEPTKHHPGVCGAGVIKPGSSLGTITMYDRSTLASYPAYNSDLAPLGNWTVDAVNPFTLAPYEQNATIGGCYSLLAGPAGLTFDASGYLFVVNNAGADAFDLSCVPRYITVYAPGAVGDQFPTALMGLFGATAGTLRQPIAAAVDQDDDVYVTDFGDNSIKIFYPFTNFDGANFFFQGELEGVIQGKHTKLKAPEGIAIDAANDALYVVNSDNNSLLMFTDFPTSGGDIPPTLIVSGRHAKMNFPVGVALPAFTPQPTSTDTVSATRD